MFNCKCCFDRGVVAVSPDMPPSPKYSGEPLKDWQDKWHKYWTSPEYKERIDNLPKMPYNYLSEQFDYVKIGVYPCPECYLSPDGKGVDYE